MTLRTDTLFTAALKGPEFLSVDWYILIFFQSHEPFWLPGLQKSISISSGIREQADKLLRRSHGRSIKVMFSGIREQANIETKSREEY